ncbi:hypothetical protein AAGG74_14995 [Bacillus mexicanus]|uniref:hypothetical protein n=1 Tax=Bacillus mexicanus TaxID=2834415 RepID=UPI003D204E5F
MTKNQELLKVIEENPGRELVLMYPSEGSEYSYTMGKASKIIIDEYVIDDADGRVWYRTQDEDELKEKLWNEIAGMTLGFGVKLTDDQEKHINEKVDAEVAKMNWKPAVVVYISSSY